MQALLRREVAKHKSREDAECLLTQAVIKSPTVLASINQGVINMSPAGVPFTVLPVQCRWQNSALMTSRVGSDPIAEGAQSDSSRFSTSASESGDDWSASDDEAGTQQGLDSIPLDSIIGRGAFGSVYRTTWKGQPAAIKVWVLRVLVAEGVATLVVCLATKTRISGLHGRP